MSLAAHVGHNAAACEVCKQLPVAQLDGQANFRPVQHGLSVKADYRVI
jgi:hypothetical protein